MASFSGAGSGVLLTITNNLSLTPVDLTILGIFLAATLIVGLSYGRQVKTIHDYALGDQNFSTYTLVATVTATFVTGSGFFILMENTYTSGLYFIIPFLGIPLQLWLQGQLAMRMGEFMNHVSIAEAMGSMYGKTVQIITAVSSILARLGSIAIKFKAIVQVIVALFDIQEEWATAIAAGVTICYSSFGGIKSVTFTDVFQFFTFGVVLPVLALVVWLNLQDSGKVVATLASNPTFDLRQVFNWDTKSLSMVGLFVYCVMPTLQPELFQRISMAKSPTKARRMLTYSAGALLLVDLVMVLISVLILVDKPGLEKGQVFSYLIDTHTYSGLKGLLGVGVIAMAMSTADSSLNSIAVIFANDLVKPLTGKTRGLVTIARAFSAVAGFFALFLALYNQDFLKLVLLSVSFYMPIFAIPFLMAVLGFRTSKRAVLLSMVAGGLAVILCKNIFPAFNAVVWGMLANLVMLLGSHYLLGEPGGWLKVDPNSPLGLERVARKEVWRKCLQAIRAFQLYPYLQRLLPPTEGYYTR